MADTLIGKWKSDLSKLQGYDDFRTALEPAESLPQEPATMDIEITKTGSEVSVRIQKDGRDMYSVTIRDGKSAVMKGPDGSENDIQGQVDGDRISYEFSFKSNDIHSTIYVDGDGLIQEQRVKTAVLVNRFKRI